MSSNWLTIFTLIAGIASIGGAVFSWQAWLKAKAAVEAAKEARDAVRKSNAGEDLEELSKIANELLNFVQNGPHQGALMRSRDLLAGISRACSRWDAFWGAETSGQVRRAAKRVGHISRALSAGEAAINEEARKKMLEYCHEVVIVLARESGEMSKQMEGGAS